MLTNKRLLFSLLIALSFALLIEQRVFVDSTAINDDVRNQIYWMARLLDPSLFPNDYIASYFTQASMVSPILALVYKLGLFITADPKIITQFLPFGIILITTFLLFKAAEAFAGSVYAFWICFAFNSYIWTMKYTAGGLARAFFYPLFFLFFWTLAKKKYNWLIFSLILQAFIYPTACFLSVFTLLIDIVISRFKQAKFDLEKIKVFLLGTLASALILYYRYIYLKVPGFGPQTSLEEALKIPHFYLDGKTCVFLVPYDPTGAGLNISNLMSQLLGFLSQGASILILILALPVLYILAKKFFKFQITKLSSPSYLWTSSLASVILFIAAYSVLFYLYLPHRYVAYTLPLVPVFLVGALLYNFEINFSKKPILVVALAIATFAAAHSLWREDLIHVSKSEMKLYSFLKTTAKDSMIVAPLYQANNIPSFSYRSVLINTETYIPFHKAYYTEVDKRFKDTKKFYSTNDPSYISSFIDSYDIDYVVVENKSKDLAEDSPLRTMPKSREVFKTKRFTVLKF